MAIIWYQCNMWFISPAPSTRALIGVEIIIIVVQILSRPPSPAYSLDFIVKNDISLVPKFYIRQLPVEIFFKNEFERFFTVT